MELTFLAFIVQGLLTVCDWLSHTDHRVCFWLFLLATMWFHSLTAGILTFVSGFFAWLASMKRYPGELPLYKGPLDVLMGRGFRASTQTSDMLANNNVSITTYGDKLVVAYRKAETHFASASAKIIVATASFENFDDWTIVWMHSTGKDDLREVLLWEFKGKLFLYFACLETNKKSFVARGMRWTSTTDLKVWSDPVDMGRATEITWDIKVRQDDSGPVAYKVGYIGNHYGYDANLTVVFEKSIDGEKWETVSKDLAVYVGGVSEVSFAFTANGDLVAIGRNEDGDRTGFGTQLFFAPKDNLGSWVPLTASLPYRFDSPQLVMMEGELVLFARYAQEKYGFASSVFTVNMQRVINLIMYSARPKSAAVYRLCPPDHQGAWPKEPIELIRCFEECYGDTGFFSVAKLGNSGEWAVANYSSKCHSHACWIYGQLFPTDVFVFRCVPVRRSTHQCMHG